jgi:amphi-Trp domain-containing protein
MPNRDVESIRSRSKFVTLLRRVADAIEAGESVRIQVAKQRVVVPADAQLSVEHEVEGALTELELQLKWKQEGVPTGTKKRTKAKPAKSKAKKRAA